MLIINVEDDFGLRNLDEIAEVEAVDIIFIGIFDLSKALGVPGDVESPTVLNALKEAVEVIHRYNKKVGSIAASPQCSVF